jgi:DNA modification methylase
MTKKTVSVAEIRKYAVRDVSKARDIALVWITNMHLENAISFGLPEVDDRYHIWRVPLVATIAKEKVGEVVIDAKTTLIIEDKSTKQDVLEARLLGRKLEKKVRMKKTLNGLYKVSSLRNTVAQGDSEEILQDLPSESIDLVFTSPPYYNARPEYTDYITYEEYLLKLRKVIQNTHRVLNEGRFFVMNVSPIIIRRNNRSEASKRIAVPFDIHRIFIEEGFDFMEDIIWVKPEGAGWALGRGRRFAADRNPLQYKAVPVTEYILVYRKHTDKLIDWNIRNYPNQEVVRASRIEQDYDKTNIWYIKPAHSKFHPAIFPDELVEKVITYYSFKSDVVLDPFAGIGTVGKVAARLHRRFVLIEQEPKYIKVITQNICSWIGKSMTDVFFQNCTRPVITPELF